ncbi:hypothetical protein FHR81_003260 [Actinoalloteichus hoggarensis]|uniref:hypothetical protein n=1 Tax=Actinoalloteichus hoggarensis TaxID=1470176 RepID=UPI00146FBABE|nr:hypothetical protein [Actinoalloteichus hoggarensis]MBB5922208.1 hypothetical protein [Actinoalloteichus hoggarensis]
MVVVALMLAGMGVGGLPAAAQLPSPDPPPPPSCELPDFDPVLCLPDPGDPGAELPEECQVQPPAALPPECVAPPAPPEPSPEPAPEPEPETPPQDPGQSEVPEEESSCGLTDIGACIDEAVDDFFRSVVVDALNPLLDLLGRTLLTTPTPDSLPRVGELWESSWQILLASYGVLVLIAGILIMSYESLQTRYTIKELVPRIAVGFLAGALSLFVATQAITVANALSAAVMDGGVEATSAAENLEDLILGSLAGGFFIIILGLVLAGLLLALLVTYVVRVAMTIILVVGAPIALMFHALPHTEGIAKWWWKAFGGCLAIQVVQSLTLITAMRVFLGPGGFTLFGPDGSSLVNLVVALALMYILFKIPFWVMSSVSGGGRSMIGSLAKGWLAYKTFGLLGGGGRGRGSGSGKTGGTSPPAGGTTPVQTGGRASPPPAGGRSWSTRTAANGQYVLPLPGVRKTRRPSTGTSGHGTPSPSNAAASSAAGQQLPLPLGKDWPENRPVLGRDGQYRLPLDVERRPAPQPGHHPAAPSPHGHGRRGGKQLELPLDPYQGNHPDRTGQYRLPLEGVHRTSRSAASPPPRSASPPPRPPSRSRVRQPQLPFDPYQGTRADRTGQYRLPLDGIHRTTPSPPPSPGAAAPASTPPPRRGRQLPLPLGLPRTPRPPAPPSRRTDPKGGEKSS